MNDTPLPPVTLEAESEADNFTHSPSINDIHVPGYTLLAELGRGGMGVVYKARDNKLKRLVALKIILTGKHTSNQARERFRIEAETIARLKHPGIVQIHAIGENAGHPYLALELVEGGGLEDYLQEKKQPFQWCAAMMLQISRIIHSAHQQGIIHRDLKPDNILLEAPGQGLNDSNSDTHLWNSGIFNTSSSSPLNIAKAKVTDFGLAREIDTDINLTHAGDIIGTPAYMAPEQINDRDKIGVGTDIYALGVMLYRFLTAHTPFQTGDAIQTLRRVLHDDPASPRKYRPDTPKDLETICLKCLMKKPEDRYLSAEQLARDLQYYLKGEPILAHPLSPTQQLFRWARQKPVMAFTYSSSLIFYSVHLVLMLILDLPQHQGFFHWFITALFLGWCIAATVLQKLLDSERWKSGGEYGLIIIPGLLITSAFLVNNDPCHTPFDVYLLGPVISVLVAPYPHMLWFMTLFGICMYLSLLSYMHFVLQVSCSINIEQIILFVMLMILMGMSMHLLLRRIKD